MIRPFSRRAPLPPIEALNITVMAAVHPRPVLPLGLSGAAKRVPRCRPGARRQSHGCFIAPLSQPPAILSGCCGGGAWVLYARRGCNRSEAQRQALAAGQAKAQRHGPTDCPWPPIVLDAVKHLMASPRYFVMVFGASYWGKRSLGDRLLYV